MAKRLLPGEIDQMKQMVVQGVAPEDIAHHFGIAISSVHNYKNRFKEEGLEFPSIRGKRPSGEVSKPAGSVQPRAEVNPPVTQPFPAATLGTTTPQGAADGYQFVVNGVKVHISSQAKSVNIDKNFMEIKF